MSDIICQWLNADLRLSKVVEPYSLSRDFANGYLIGEILYKFELQDDFHLFSKHSTENAKLNNFTRIKPTLQLLDVPFDLTMAKSIMQGKPAAAPQLLHRLYIVLEKKKRSGLTATAIEVMQPVAKARLHRVEKDIYTERLKTVVKRETDLKIQQIAKRFNERGQDVYHKLAMNELLQEKERKRWQEERRLKDIEKHRQVRRQQQQMMIKMKSAVVQIPKPPPAHSSRGLERRQQLRKQQEVQDVRRDIAQFEQNQKAISPDQDGALLYSHVTQPMNADEKEQWNREYMEDIRLRLTEDKAAQEQREMRRRRFLMKQFKAHEAQQEALRDEQLVKRLTRQTQQEKRIAVQLMQIKRQKEVLRQNRIFQGTQYQERRLRDIQEAMYREEVLAQQERLERSEEIRMELERNKHLTAERADARNRKHFDICRGILGQIVDLATKVGEYRLLTDNLIPKKMMREWMELFLSGKPLYEVDSVEPVPAEPTPEQIIELQKLQILNNQDYDDYVEMKGEWVWPEEGESQAPPLNNDILDHVLKLMQGMIKPPITNTPPPLFPRFTIRACVLGKTYTGKTTCLTRISSVLGVCVLSANTLIQDVLTAYQQEKQPTGENQMESEQCLEKCGSPTEGIAQPQKDEEETSSPPDSGSDPHESETSGLQEKEDAEKVQWSLKAQRGAAIEKVLMAGKTVPDQMLMDIIVDAISDVPADSGWVLDGFPLNITQAMMMEKALTGAEPDETQQNTHVDKKTPEDSPQPSPALDLVVLLDVSDEQVIERAFSRAVKEESRDQDHDVLEEQKSLERDQISYRISGFHDTWPKLEKWFGAKQNILVKVPAETDEDLLFKNVETILKDTMELIKQGDAPSRCRTMSTSSKHTHAESPRSSGPSPMTPRFAERVYVDESLPQEIPEYLVPYWENVCASYVTNVKVVMQNLRGERELIIHYLYDIRENFRQHLLKPDLKQEFVSAWQRDYNSVPENIREDEETKGELHQRLDDLRERLCDICDKRRDEAVQERAGVIDDGWLDDHTALLINHYSALMQTEVGRFQDFMFLLRDYYSGMNKAPLSQTTCDFIHVPLLDITWSDHMEQETSNISSGSGPSEKHAENAGKKVTEVDDKKKMFPLVAGRSSSNELSKQDLLHPDEKLLQEFYQTTVTAVTSMVSAVIHQQDEGDEQQQQMETEKAHGQSRTPNVAKDKRKAGKQKGVPPPSQEPSPQPVVENPEEVKRKALRRRIQQEYTDALKHEELAAKMRLELVKSHGLKTLCSLQQKTEQGYRNMQDWLEARFLSEMKSIDQMTEIVQQHIENGLQIRYELMLHGADFYVDGDTRVVPSAPPTPPPPLLEQHSDGTLTVQQLNIFCAQLHKTAPSGLLSGNELIEVLEELTSPHLGSDVLPEPWMHMTPSQVVELVCVFTRDSEMLDWRKFLLCTALPWPFPSRTRLIKTLQHYRAIDTAGNGLITQEQYMQVELWFPSDKDHLVPNDPSAPLPFDRLNNLKKFFFTLFASTDPSSVMLDYMDMLLYFCCHSEPTQGFIRALSLVTEHPLHYKHTSPLVQSVSHLVDAEFDADEEEGRGVESDEVGVSVDDVLRVLSHGENRISAHPNRFHMNCRSRDEYREELLKVWKELGFKSEEKILFSMLSQHPFLQDLMETSSQYLFVDIHKILQSQKTERDFKS